MARSWLRLPVQGRATSASAASLGRQVRRVVSRRVHPPAAWPRLRGHSLSELPSALERARPGPSPLRRRSGRDRVRGL